MNVVVIVADSCRVDHLGFHGSSVKAPNELYDRTADPKELTNVLDSHADVAADLGRRLRDFADEVSPT